MTTFSVSRILEKSSSSENVPKFSLKSLKRYQKIPWICSLWYKNLLNYTWYTNKFCDWHRTYYDIHNQLRGKVFLIQNILQNKSVCIKPFPLKLCQIHSGLFCWIRRRTDFRAFVCWPDWFWHRLIPLHWFFGCDRTQ